ncbi:hypothetical protein GCM10010228_25210 [Streptomyces massasporeus]|nr:hypothetical protein GCM10010228_25210 [Streptomyces massasporeus]
MRGAGCGGRAAGESGGARRCAGCGVGGCAEWCGERGGVGNPACGKPAVQRKRAVPRRRAGCVMRRGGACRGRMAYGSFVNGERNARAPGVSRRYVTLVA